jgi:hypothetical protein
MLGKLHENSSRELFRTRLEDLINPQHELALLAKKIEWNCFEEEFKGFYSEKPTPRLSDFLFYTTTCSTQSFR